MLIISSGLKGENNTSTMSDLREPICSSVSGCNSFQPKRTSSLVPSGVSLEIDQSMQMQNNYSGKPVPPPKSFLKKSNSSEPSTVSLRSDRSMQNPINYKGKPSPPEKRIETNRSRSPVLSCVSLKSDRSMQIPINYNEGLSSPENRLQQNGLNSPALSVSIKSDRSMQNPINYKGISLPPEKSFLKMSKSSEPSTVSLRSDRSMQNPINYKEKPSPPEKSFQLKRSNTSVPSVLSLKSDKSMQIPINYEGEPLPPTESTKDHFRTTEPRDTKINTILCEDINPREALHDSNTLEVPNEKLKFSLRERYQHLFEGTAQQGSLVPLDRVYTKLYITESMNEQFHSLHEVGQIETSLKIVTVDKLIKCKDIFNPLLGQSKPRTVLTKGVAGIGKTVTVQKFILDWAEGETNQDIHFVFPLPFREMNLMKDKTYSLNDLLQHFFIQEFDASSSEITNHSVFIFDGLDECRLPLDFQNNENIRDVTKAASVDVLLTNLIKGNLLPSAQIWITSRPAACGCIPTECVDRVTEVRGFNDPQKEEYFRKRINDQSLANGIITHLKSLRSLYIMCHIPVFCWIAATVLERMVVDCGWENMPRSLTQLYTHFLITQINTKKAKYSDNKAVDREMIFKLGKLAFEQLEKGNLIFYEEDLTECGIDVREASVYSGVFTQIFREDFGLFQRNVFSFVHLSIQEHLAALYVFLSFHNHNQNVLSPQQASDSEKTVTMEKLLQTAVDKASESESGHLDLFLRFLMGFSLESTQNILRDLLIEKSSRTIETKGIIGYLKYKIRHNVCAHLSVRYFHCLNELNDSSLVKEIEIFLRDRNQNEENLSPELWSALVYIILTSDKKLDVLELRKYVKSDKGLFCLLPVMKLSERARLNNCRITARGCAALALAFSLLKSVKEIDLSHNHIQDYGVKLLCTGITSQHMDTMQTKTSATDNKSALASVLSKVPASDTVDNLDKLLQNFLDIIETYHNIKEFSGLMGTPCVLEILRLKNCGLTSVGCQFLALVLSSSSLNLTELDLSQNNIGDSGVEVLCDTLQKVSHKLDTLKMNNCKITEHSCSALALALQVNSALKAVSLNNNDLQDSGVKLLAAGLETPHCKLESLWLSNCNIRLEGFISLASAMRTNPSHLKVLDLSKNRPGLLGLKLLFAALKNPQFKLETLKLNECGITEKSCATLGSALNSESSSLRELDLSINDLQDSGAKLLSVGLRNPHCKLQKLTLYKCGISKQGYAALAEALQSEPSSLKDCCVVDNEPKGSREQIICDTG
ncbi:NACHT, LRR and PYD domains-containing protein 3-like isoform X2 [Hoplias malabaricus]|uniref:NACHT, LRR and PYD domains-containing protein 3-like isoform X2 n=1 Tax=Hoplias malabaricus TaxID=27720 RepID=UPI003461A0BE